MVLSISERLALRSDDSVIRSPLTHKHVAIYLALMLLVVIIPFLIFWNMTDVQFEYVAEFQLHLLQQPFKHVQLLTVIYVYLPVAAWFWLTRESPNPIPCITEHQLKTLEDGVSADMHVPDGNMETSLEIVDKASSTEPSRDTSRSITPLTTRTLIRNDSRVRHEQVLTLSQRMVNVMIALLLPRLCVIHLIEQNGLEMISQAPFIANFLFSWLFHAVFVVTPIFPLTMSPDFSRVLIGVCF